MEIKKITDKKIWEDFVLSQHPNTFLQSWHWGEVHQRLGKRIFRLGLFDNQKLIGAAQLIKEEAKRGTHFIIPAGPILIDWQEIILGFFIEEIKKLAEKEGAIFVRVRPNIENSKANSLLFKKMGFVIAPMYLHAESTIQLDLNLSEVELLSQMRKNTRYAIRRAERDGVQTVVSRNSKDIDLLYKLQMETVKRHHFSPFSKEFFDQHFQAFLADNQIVFIKALYQGEVLSIGMFIFYGDTAVYHYSGSSSKHPKIPAAYAMLWQAIREAKKRGCRIFDLWGIAPTDNPRHRFSGVTLFKKGFGGSRVDYLHAQDLPLSRLYWLSFIFETARRLKRRV